MIKTKNKIFIDVMIKTKNKKSPFNLPEVIFKCELKMQK